MSMWRWLWILVGIALVAPISARGQAEDQPATPIVVRPAAEPVPAMKYRLLPLRRSLEQGNAALNYHRATQMSLEFLRTPAPMPGSGEAAPTNVEMQVADWNALPLDQIPLDKANKTLELVHDVLAETERGTRQEFCDWGLSRRPEGIQLLLPEIQNARSLSRLLTLQTRVAIREGKLDEAWRWIGVALVLGRHVGEGDILIQGLVGVAIDTAALRCVEEFIQAPGAPNLYWALANRPRPFLDLQPALEGELTAVDRELPELTTLDDGVWSQDQARRFVDNLQRKIAEVGGRSSAGNAFLGRLGVAAMALKLYPEARAALIAEGKPAAEVEAMPVVQVAALHTFGMYQRLRDDRFKWLGLPYAKSYGPLSQLALVTPQEGLANPLLALFGMLEPSLNAARLAELRLERQFDALQAIEAIRLHAAAHGGALPAKLDDVTIVPVLPNPITGKPFDYAKDGDTATLSAPVPPGMPPSAQWASRYRLTLDK